MREYRPSKDTDQDNIERALDLLRETMNNHQEIEPTLWAGAIWSCLVVGYINCDFTYKEFCEEVDKAKTYYKCWWK